MVGEEPGGGGAGIGGGWGVGAAGVLCWEVAGSPGGVQRTGDVRGKQAGWQPSETQREGRTGSRSPQRREEFQRPGTRQAPIILTTSPVSGVVLGLTFREAKGTKATQDLLTDEEVARWGRGDGG